MGTQGPVHGRVHGRVYENHKCPADAGMGEHWFAWRDARKGVRRRVSRIVTRSGLFRDIKIDFGEEITKRTLVFY